MNLGEKILKLRKEQGLSQEAIGDLLKVTRQTVSNWELNITSPNIEQLKMLSNVFNISIDELLDNDTQNILEKKINNTEKLAKKHLKIAKIMLITIYFILLITFISIAVYFFTKKDLTEKFQDNFTCTIGEKQWHFVLTNDDDKNIIKQYYNNSIESEEEYNAGDSIYENFESLKIIKKVMIENGATCK